MIVIGPSTPAVILNTASYSILSLKIKLVSEDSEFWLFLKTRRHDREYVYENIEIDSFKQPSFMAVAIIAGSSGCIGSGIHSNPSRFVLTK